MKDPKQTGWCDCRKRLPESLLPMLSSHHCSCGVVWFPLPDRTGFTKKPPELK